ncbi:MAG: glycoside hydrolase family 3 C-terminal domain-containing protein [Bacteroidales bacterium]|nr:glycoside hydrolase family 3 C-terminal domain-containing protein [Bacteroidales bacterium]
MDKVFLMIILSLSLVTCKNKTEQTDYPSVDLWKNPTLTADERVKDLLSRMTLEEKISQMTNHSTAIERLGIPEYDWWNECLHGVARAGKATVFPQAIGLAATFDEDLIFRVASAISDEARAKYNAAQKKGNTKRYMGLTFWTPNINIFRDPRWGRGQETYGEDPFLTSTIGIAFVKGLQGNDPRYLKTAACAKHYVVHSGPEAIRHEFNAEAPLKDFYETYLPAFEDLVKKADVEAVMCAYNRTYKLPCCGSGFLLKELLRDNWGFDGHIVSDCGALNDFYDGHNVVENAAEAAAMALKAGVNVDCGRVYPSLKEAVEKNLVTEAEIDMQLSYLLRTRFRLGMFDPPELVPFTLISEDVVRSDENISLSREAAVKSIVMLKNNGALPLKKDLNDIQIVGVHGNDAQVLYGNYHGLSENAVTVVEGIMSKIGPGTKADFRQGTLLAREKDNPIDWTSDAAATADAVIAVMGISNLIEGEEGASIASAHKGDRMDIKLPGNQVKFLKSLRSRGDAPIILVVTGGSPISLVEVEDIADAILFVWYPGEQGGNAVADIIFGDANPSGRLPVTFPKGIEQLPDYENYSMEGRTYRYMQEEPEFAFGFGLSYTTFEYFDLILNSENITPNEILKIEVSVKNTGKRAGEEVVQLYLTDLEASARTPMYALKGMKRVHLDAGEAKTISFELVESDFALVTENGEKITEPGSFRITIGAASPSPSCVKKGSAIPVSKEFTLK